MNRTILNLGKITGGVLLSLLLLVYWFKRDPVSGQSATRLDAAVSGLDLPAANQKLGENQSTAPVLPSSAPNWIALSAKPDADAPALVNNRWSQATVIEERSAWNSDRTLLSRVRLVQTDFKYSLVRLEEIVRSDVITGQEELVAQVAMVGDHLLVTVTADADPAEFSLALADAGASIRRRQPNSDVYLVAVPKEIEGLEKALAYLRARPDLTQVVEPDVIVSTFRIPNEFGEVPLYWLENLGFNQGVADADMDATEAWEITTGSRSVRVGLLDTGMQLNHSDLVGNLWTNPNEIKGNGIDDDRNGYVDDVHGWNFVNDNNDSSDNDGHGTAVAGVLGAEGDNGLGIVGVNWRVSLVPLKFLSSEGIGTTSDAVEAIRYSIRMGIEITCNSWGGTVNSTTLLNVISDANAANQLFVAAAGNDGVNIDTVGNANYPAEFNLPNIVSVAATDDNDNLAPYSNFGRTTVDIAAAGTNIVSTALSYGNGDYRFESGTSMATPQVAGAAALIRAQLGNITVAQLKTILLESVDPLPSLSNRVLTGGRLNLARALKGKNRTLAKFVFDPLPATLVRGQSIPIRIRALTSTNLPVGSFDTPVTITASGTTLGTSVIARDWIGGVWTGHITPTTDSTSATFRLIHTASGRSGVSSTFAVAIGPIASFHWSGLLAGAAVDTPFYPTLRAADAGGNLLATFNGRVELSLRHLVLRPPIIAPSTILAQPFYGGDGAVVRTQVYYSDKDMGGIPRSLAGLAFDVNRLGSQSLFRQFTIRLKNTERQRIGGLAFDRHGWTTVYVGDLPINRRGWQEIHFSAPFAYAAAGGLIVDFSFRNSAVIFNTPIISGHETYSGDYVIRTLSQGSANPSADPFVFKNPVRVQRFPILRWLEPVDSPFRPAAVDLLSGNWSGALSIPYFTPGTRLVAVRSGSPAVLGISAPLTLAPPPFTLRQPFPFEENWESGTIAPRWEISGSAAANVTLEQEASGGADQPGGLFLSMRSSGSNAVTTTMDLAGHRSVTFSFWAAKTDAFPREEDIYEIYFSNDGTNWHQALSIPGQNVSTSWREFSVVLDPFLSARGLVYGSNFRLRFSRVTPSINYHWSNGLKLDQIRVRTTPEGIPSLELPNSISESSGVHVVALRVSSPLTVATSFALTSSAVAKLTVPATVVLPAGQTRVTFAVTAINDTILDGDRIVDIEANPTTPGSGLFRGHASLLVTDDESTSYTLTASASILGENQTTGLIGRITLGTTPAYAATFILASDLPGDIALPASVTVNPGERLIEFPILPVNNGYMDDPRSAVVSARLGLGPVASINIGITDDELRNIHLGEAFNSILYENGSTLINLSVSAVTRQPLTINLASLNPDLLTSVNSVTIPAGADNVNFTIHGVDDSLLNGQRSAILTASAPGFSPATKSYTVNDNDPARYKARGLPEITANKPFSLQIDAFSIDNRSVPIPESSIYRLRARAGSASEAIPVTPSSFSFWSSQASFSNVWIHNPGEDLNLEIVDPEGRAFTVAVVDVGTGPLQNLDITPLSPLPIAGHPAVLSITAKDSFGNLLAALNQPFSLGITGATRIARPASSTNISFTDFTTGSSRAQLIYLASEIGNAPLVGLSLSMRNSSQNIYLPSLSLILRVKATSLSAYSSGGDWDNAGWTVLYQGPVTPSVDGWAYMPFSSPYQPSLGANLALDIIQPASFNPFGMTSDGFYVLENRARRSTFAFLTTDPATWTAATQPIRLSGALPFLRLHPVTPVQITPSSPATLQQGRWTGAVVFDRSSAQPVQVFARAGALAGLASPTEVLSSLIAPTLAPEPEVTGSTSNTLAWSPVPGADGYEINATTSPSFTGALVTARINEPVHTFNMLEETRWHYRVRATRSLPPGVPGSTLSGNWSGPVFSIQDATPPRLTIASASIADSLDFRLTGTASDANGLSALFVNEQPVTVSAAWSHDLALVVGANPFTLRLSDRATPPNITEMIHVIVRSAPGAPDPFPSSWRVRYGFTPSTTGGRDGPGDDADADGKSNLLEYALGSDPLRTDASAGPTMTISPDPQSGNRHMEFTFIRRTDDPRLRYEIETSVDLASWQISAMPPEQIRRENLLGEGTERVTYKLHPALGSTSRFARLKITVD